MVFFLLAVCGVVAYHFLAEPSGPASPVAASKQNETAARKPDFKPTSALLSPSGKRRPVAQKPPRTKVAVKVKEGGETTAAPKDKTEVKEPESETGKLSISGKVVDMGGKPIANVTVELGAVMRPRSSATAPNGTFEFTNLPEGNYHLKASKELFVPAELREVAAGTRDVSLVLEAQSTISGRVVSGLGGAPLKAFKIAVFSAPPPDVDVALLRSNLPWQPRQDDAGHFVVENVPNDVALVVAAIGEGHAMGYIEVDPIARGMSAEGVEVRLPAGGRVEGRVCDTAGKAVPDAAIYVGTNNSGAPEIQTDAQGRFVVTTISSGDTALTASHAGYTPASAEIASPTGITIVLESGGVIEGTVRQGGQPVAGVRVSAQATQQVLQTNLAGVTDAEGRYCLTGVPEGEVIVGVLSPSWTPRSSHSIQQHTVVEMGKPSQVDFTLPSSSAQIEGTVLVNGQPPESGYISVNMTDSSGDVSLVAPVDPDGHYRAENLPGGRVTMRVTVIGRDGAQRWKTADLQISDGQTEQRNFEFTAKASVSGAVSGIGGGETATVMAIAGEYVAALPLTEAALTGMNPYVVGTSEVDGGGRYRIEGLDAGIYTMVAITRANRAPEMRSAFLTMTLEAGTETQVNLTVN